MPLGTMARDDLLRLLEHLGTRARELEVELINKEDTGFFEDEAGNIAAGLELAAQAVELNDPARLRVACDRLGLRGR
jgi:hypothetical protein